MLVAKGTLADPLQRRSISRLARVRVEAPRSRAIAVTGALIASAGVNPFMAGRANIGESLFHDLAGDAINFAKSVETGRRGFFFSISRGEKSTFLQPSIPGRARALAWPT